MASVGSYGYKRDAVRVKVTKYDGRHSPENRKFSVDPQITSFEVLQSLLAKAFDIRGEFTVCYKFLDDYGQETYLALLSDWDLDAAFISASEPYLDLRVDVKIASAAADDIFNHCVYSHNASADDDWEPTQGQDVGQSDPILEIRQAHKLPGILMNKMGRTLNNVVQRAFNLAEEHGHVLYNTHNQLQHSQPEVSSVPPRSPLTDAEFRKYLDPIGQVIKAKELRSVIYLGGIEPSLRKVVWKHLLNVYPAGMSGKERMDYMKRKAAEYRKLRDSWKEMYKNEQMVGDLAYVTGMVKKDVLRTDRHHVFYAGSDDNKNIASLFNILTTYALNHPAVSYCQGMSDLASPLLVTMNDEAHAYICFCGLMQRLAPNFLLDGITMTKRFQHLAEGLLYYDPNFYSYLKLHQADDLLFCYRWLLLEMKREFAFDEALRMLEVMWSSVIPLPPEKELPLYQKEFCASPVPISPRPRETPYTKVCALRRQSSSASLSLDGGLALRGRGRARLSRQNKTRPYASMDESQLTTRSNSDSPVNEKSSTRVVKNLNEFLSLDKNLRIGRKFIGSVDEPGCDKIKNYEHNYIEEENSQDDINSLVSSTSDRKDFRTLSCGSKGDSIEGELLYKKKSDRKGSDEEDDNNYESSPDDSSSEIYPSMTTSMTHELRLELENLDRQVFSNTEKPSQPDVNTSGVVNNTTDDVFIWENPLRNSTSRRSTPDEQVDLEFDVNNSSSSSSYSDVFKSEQNSVKSVTSVKSFKRIPSDTLNSKERGSVANDSSCSNVDENKSLLERRKIKLDELRTTSTTSTTSNGNITSSNTSCDSSNSINLTVETVTSLPPPEEFGGGNPFLMFLCITVLQQHRDLIMKTGMDYNEMAMHFDKMVRKHNVTKVLNQARMMYADYMKQHNSNLFHLII